MTPCQIMINVEERAERARNNFKSGYNCAQSVVLAFSDIFKTDEAMLLAMTSGFGGGMGRLREVCGTVSGMAFIAGLALPATDPSDKKRRTENYALVQECAGEFRRLNGSIVCKELLGLVPMNPSVAGTAPAPPAPPAPPAAAAPVIYESPEPSDRTEEYYRKRPCVELVGISAGIIAKKLVELGY